ncbi:MAG: hypothetical protein GY830_10030 [Bacteroidetes bacterium]|nr:hypothetical protein [Bacteroidota bacterium]
MILDKLDINKEGLLFNCEIGQFKHAFYIFLILSCNLKIKKEMNNYKILDYKVL